MVLEGGVSRVDQTTGAAHLLPGLVLLESAGPQYTVDHVLSCSADKDALNTLADKLGLPKRDRKAFSEAVGVAATRQSAAAATPATVVPVWLEQARETVGRSMKPFVTVDGGWDVYIIVKVMQGFFREVFAPKLTAGSTPAPRHEAESSARTVLVTLLQVVERRTRRAHSVNEPPTTASEALESLRCMRDVLALFGEAAAAATIQQLLEDAQDLMRLCRTHQGKYCATYLGCSGWV